MRTSKSIYFQNPLHEKYSIKKTSKKYEKKVNI